MQQKGYQERKGLRETCHVFNVPIVLGRNDISSCFKANYFDEN